MSPGWSAARERKIIRLLHLLLSIPILGFLYGPVASIPPAARFTRWIAMPLVILSGLWMWLKPKIIKYLRQSRTNGAGRVHTSPARASSTQGGM
jgi:hypothetical protein